MPQQLRCKSPLSAFTHCCKPCNAVLTGLIAGLTCLQASPWTGGFLSSGLKSEELKSEEAAEEGCPRQKGFSGMPSAAGEAGVCSELLSLSAPTWSCQVVTSTQSTSLSDKWASYLSPEWSYCWRPHFGCKPTPNLVTMRCLLVGDSCHRYLLA